MGWERCYLASMQRTERTKGEADRPLRRILQQFREGQWWSGVWQECYRDGLKTYSTDSAGLGDGLDMGVREREESKKKIPTFLAPAITGNGDKRTLKGVGRREINGSTLDICNY